MNKFQKIGCTVILLSSLLSVNACALYQRPVKSDYKNGCVSDGKGEEYCEEIATAICAKYGCGFEPEVPNPVNPALTRENPYKYWTAPGYPSYVRVVR